MSALSWVDWLRAVVFGTDFVAVREPMRTTVRKVIWSAGVPHVRDTLLYRLEPDGNVADMHMEDWQPLTRRIADWQRYAVGRRVQA